MNVLTMIRRLTGRRDTPDVLPEVAAQKAESAAAIEKANSVLSRRDERLRSGMRATAKALRRKEAREREARMRP